MAGVRRNMDDDFDGGLGARSKEEVSSGHVS